MSIIILFLPKMKIQLIQIGKTTFSFLTEGEKMYGDRIKRFTKFEQITIPNLKKGSKMSQAQVKEAEGKLILKKKTTVY